MVLSELLVTALVTAVVIINLSAPLRFSFSQRPALTYKCDSVAKTVNEYIRINKQAPRLSALSGDVSGLAKSCMYQRNFDAWSMTSPQKPFVLQCGDLGDKMVNYVSIHGYLPDVLDTQFPEIKELAKPCGFERGDRIHYGMEVPGEASCSMDPTGGCTASDCRNWWQRALDAAGFIRPPFGRSTWSFSSRLGDSWMQRCQGDVALSIDID